MINLNVYKIKFGLLNEQDEEKLELLLYKAFFNNFSKKEVEDYMIQDEENRILIVFISKSEKYRVDNLVRLVKKFKTNVIEVYEDITDKILYKNDLSAYDYNHYLIKKFIKSNLDVDDVLDKINFLGKDKLTNVDMEILKEVSY